MHRGKEEEKSSGGFKGRRRLGRGCGWDKKNAIKNHFSNLNVESVFSRPVLDGIDFATLGSSQCLGLSAVFTMDELEDSVNNCDGNKTPGLDGFNLNFIRKFWEVIKLDVWGVDEEFYYNVKLPKGMMSHFMALIPKTTCPQGLADFRPISLLGCTYKILTMMLVSRLRAIMNYIISDNQSAFIPGRNLLDGVVIINEVVDNQSVFIFKVDFEKEYDMVNWSFLDYMM